MKTIPHIFLSILSFLSSILFAAATLCAAPVAPPRAPATALPADTAATTVKALEELTVTAEKVSYSHGKLVVIPSASQAENSASAIGLLQRLPLDGLEANPISRTLSVDGGSPVILINGVPAQMDDVNALAPTDIRKIEYSRTTPGRYTDRENTGYLNIILKKKTEGGNVYLWAQNPLQKAGFHANLRAAYNRGPSQFTVNYSPNWTNDKVVDIYRDESYVAPDFRVDLHTYERTPSNYFNNNMRLAYTYSPDLKTLFEATFRIVPYRNNQYFYETTSDTELGEYSADRKTREKGVNPSIDLFFRREFNSSNLLEAQMVGTYSTSDYRRDNKYEYSNGNREAYRMDVNSRRLSLITEVTYTHRFNDRTSLSAGYQNTLSRSRNRYLSSDYRPMLTENNNYIYAALDRQICRNLHAGISTGLKLFWINNDESHRRFIRNLTSVNLSWTPDPHWNVSGSFAYSPMIPGLSAFTDYPQQTSPYLFSNGNPDLKVADRLNYRLGISYKTGKVRISLSPALYDGRNNVYQELTYAGDGKFLSMPINGKKMLESRNELSLNVQDLYGFGLNASFNADYYRSEGDGWEHDLSSCGASVTVWWDKGPFTIMYFRKLPSKYLRGQWVRKDGNADALTLFYRPCNRLTIEASWRYMFAKNGGEYPTWNLSEVNPTVRERYDRDDANLVMLTLTYRTDFGAIFRAARRKLNNSDNSSPLLKM